MLPQFKFNMLFIGSLYYTCLTFYLFFMFYIVSVSGTAWYGSRRMLEQFIRFVYYIFIYYNSPNMLSIITLNNVFTYSDSPVDVSNEVNSTPMQISSILQNLQPTERRRLSISALLPLNAPIALGAPPRTPQYIRATTSAVTRSSLPAITITPSKNQVN